MVTLWKSLIFWNRDWYSLCNTILGIMLRWTTPSPAWYISTLYVFNRVSAYDTKTLSSSPLFQYSYVTEESQYVFETIQNTYRSLSTNTAKHQNYTNLVWSKSKTLYKKIRRLKRKFSLSDWNNNYELTYDAIIQKIRNNCTV